MDVFQKKRILGYDVYIKVFQAGKDYTWIICNPGVKNPDRRLPKSDILTQGSMRTDSENEAIYEACRIAFQKLSGIKAEEERRNKWRDTQSSGE